MLLTDGFDSPVGTALERLSAAVPPGNWKCALSYGTWYLLSGKFPAIHTGADLDLEPYGGYGEPIYATANGVVTFAKDVPGTTWRNLVVIQHRLSDGRTLCSRYGHLKDIAVQVGQPVVRGQIIGHEGNADGAFAPHLHFDLSLGNTLLTNATNWPGDDLATVERLYVNPIRFIQENRPVSAVTEQLKALLQQAEALVDQIEPPAPPPTTRQTAVKYVTAQPSMNVRATPSTASTANVIGKLSYQTAVTVYTDQADPAWWQIAATNAMFPSDYLAAQWLSDTRP